MPRSVAMRARSTSSPDAISASSKAWRLAISQRLERALALDAGLVERAVLGDARRLDLLVRRRSRRGASRASAWVTSTAFLGKRDLRARSSATSSAFGGG